MAFSMEEESRLSHSFHANVSDGIVDNGHDETCVKRIDDIPTLPQNLKYHIFLIYCNDGPDEATWAEGLIETMEGEGYKCIRPQRDFMPGEPVVKLIFEGLALSMRVVCVLSPSSLESGMCMYEMLNALDMSIRGGVNRVVPLLLKECEIPNFLKHLNYIDVPKGDDYLQKIRNCFDETDGMGNNISYMEDRVRRIVSEKLQDMLPYVEGRLRKLETANLNIPYLIPPPAETGNLMNVPDLIHVPPPVVNGRVVALKGRKVRKYRGSAWEFPQLTRYQRENMEVFKEPNSEYFYNKVIDVANADPYMTYYSVFHGNALRFLLLYLCVMLTTLLVVYVIEISTETIVISGTITYEIFFVAFGAAIGELIILVLLLFYINSKFRLKLDGKLLDLSLSNILNTKLLATRDFYFGAPTIQLMTYDIEPCLNYIAEQETQDFDELSEEDRHMARHNAESQLLSFMRGKSSFIKDWKTSPISTKERHPTEGNRACLCEQMLGE